MGVYDRLHQSQTGHFKLRSLESGQVSDEAIVTRAEREHSTHRVAAGVSVNRKADSFVDTFTAQRRSHRSHTQRSKRALAARAREVREENACLAATLTQRQNRLEGRPVGLTDTIQVTRQLIE